jgi:hypothetical protein
MLTCIFLFLFKVLFLVLRPRLEVLCKIGFAATVQETYSLRLFIHAGFVTRLRDRGSGVQLLGRSHGLK